MVPPWNGGNGAPLGSPAENVQLLSGRARLGIKVSDSKASARHQASHVSISLRSIPVPVGDSVVRGPGPERPAVDIWTFPEQPVPPTAAEQAKPN